MLTLLCLLGALAGTVVASPQNYGLPLPGAVQPTFSRQTFVLHDAPTPQGFAIPQSPRFHTNIFTSNFKIPQAITPSFQTSSQTNPAFQRTQIITPNFQSNSQTNPGFHRNQIINPNFQTSSQTNPVFQRNQIINPNFQTSNILNDFSQSQLSSPTPQSNQFNRPPVRSGIENHPFLHGNTLELLPPLQHVVGTKYPRVEASRGFRFPTSQLLNTTPPPNLLH